MKQKCPGQGHKVFILKCLADRQSGVPPIVIGVARRFPSCPPSSSSSHLLITLFPFPHPSPPSSLFIRLLSSTFLKMGCVQSSAVDEEAKARSCSPSFLPLRSAAYASSPLPLPQEMKKLRASSGGIRSWRRTKLRCCCSAQASRARCDPFIPTCLHRTIHDKIIPPSHHPSPRYSSR